VFLDIIELEYENFYLDEYPQSNDIFYLNFFERINSNYYDRYISFHFMRRVFSPYIMNSISNNCVNLSDIELIIIFHQLRNLYLKNNFSNLISFNDTYTLQYLLKKISENYILSEKNFFVFENKNNFSNENGIIFREDKNQTNKNYKMIEFLGRRIKDINKNDNDYKSALEKFKAKNGEISNEIYFEMNYYSLYKSKDKFYKDYILKINFNEQMDLEIKNSFESKNGLNTFRDLYMNFLGIFDNYKNLLSNIYYCKESKMKIFPPEYVNIDKFNLPDSFYMLISFNNINLFDSKLDVLFSINYSDLVYIYQGQNDEVLIGVYYSQEDENKSKQIENQMKNNKKNQDDVLTKNRKSFELYLKIRSDDSRLIIEDIISYCELILATNTNSDILSINDKSIFKRLDNLEALEKMNSYTINSNLIKSSRANAPFDLKDFKLVYQKRLPYLENFVIGKDSEIVIDLLFKNEAIEQIRINKNIFDINKNYNSKSILNDLISNIDDEKKNRKSAINSIFRLFI